MNQKNKKEDAWKDEDDSFLDPDAVSSTTDCTGLMPTLPRSEAEAEAYTDLHHIPKPAKKKENNSLHN